MYTLNTVKLILAIIIILILSQNIDVPKLFVYLLILCMSIDVTKSNIIKT